MKSELVQLVEEYELISRITNDLKAEKAELRIYSFECQDWLEVGEILEGVDEKIAQRLDVEVIDLRRRIREKLEEDEGKQTGLSEPAMVEQLVTNDAMPKNDYRRHRNSQEDDDGK